MNIKCAALVLVVFTHKVELTETRPSIWGSFVRQPPHSIMTRKDAEVQKREKKSLKNAD